ncbi:threonine--tRNA ligase, partial [bacterium]|nr:threonine--tRNA ligase [bacterium]
MIHMEFKMNDLEKLRHSTAHVMAQAVTELYPNTKLAIGPPIKDGFYYDFDTEHIFTPDDFAKIEERMQQIIDGDFSFNIRYMKSDEARRYFESIGEKYKVEIIDDLGEDQVSLYKQDTFEDLCKGPHVHSTGKIKAFKLLQIAGAYWRGSEKNKMLQRIYGTAFPSKKELRE